ncbi:hypothetical protein CDG76_03465 [Nostoc sp. 'Peltigera membranacea cyanobiont' 210A]|uniref:hypothetical protein n=1 Tax=Nostoc sp. 'Peltigera membranacea cyanobiont' 210A TaxID=2014529 RepID=UPI000B956C48|nr:hypothetical protein [Nostoc sp. 'Peltigera membranacea cyanobiont' 210A]OYD97903.1 hypothetical protein CDG76_03465 [Nostoc sp. 'Peltigera membranacea cyanobiont' 210A]
MWDSVGDLKPNKVLKMLGFVPQPNLHSTKIQETQNFIDILSGLIRLGEVISNAIINVGIATIGTLVRELRDIGDRLNT